MIKFHRQFSKIDQLPASEVFEIFPKIHKDGRGYFMEVLKDYGEWPKDDFPLWFTNLHWIRQINRSVSHGTVIRGCHAQRGIFCQAKLVSALTTKIYDIITDARPDSPSFGVSSVFVLDPEKQNQLFVPRGFLHSFVTTGGSEPAVFEYFCDNVYDKQSEVGVNPMTLLPMVVSTVRDLAKDNVDLAADMFDLFKIFDSQDKFTLSEKDTQLPAYQDWMNSVKQEFKENNILWYR